MTPFPLAYNFYLAAGAAHTRAGPPLMDFDLALLGLIVGVLIGLTGIGGGSLLTPALIVIFKTSPLTAVGTDLVFNAATKLFGSVQHARQETISYRLAFYLGLGSIPAALGGVGFIALLEKYDLDATGVVQTVLGVTLVAAGVLMVARPFLDRREGERERTDVRFFVPFEKRSPLHRVARRSAGRLSRRRDVDRETARSSCPCCRSSTRCP